MKKLISLVNNDIFLSLVFIFSSGYFFSIAMIATNSKEYVEGIVSAIVSIICFASGYIFYKTNADEDEPEHKKVVKVK